MIFRRQKYYGQYPKVPDYVGLCTIMLDYVGLCSIRHDCVGFFQFIIHNA